MQAQKKYRIERSQLEDIAQAQDRAMEIYRRYLQKVLQQVEAAGYTRLELATTYLMLAYHALRHNRPKEQAEKSFELIGYFARRRLESRFARSKRKLH